MFNKNKFLAILKENGKTVVEAADVMEIKPSTLYRKMNGESDFYRNEIQLFVDWLKIDVTGIFFADKVA